MKNKFIYILLLVLVVFSGVRVGAQNDTSNPGNPPSNALFPDSNEPQQPFDSSGQVEPTAAGAAAGNEETNPSQQGPSDQSNNNTAAALESELAAVEVDSGGQAAANAAGSQKSDSTISESTKAAAADVLGCSAGQILGNVLASIVSQAITAAFGKLVTTVTDKLVNVPVAEGGQTLLNSNTEAAARAGTTIGAFGFGVLVSTSWDSIAYCVVNAMITYVANSTIAWVQGGFEGNPSFVNDPEQFFKDIANIEAGAFLQDLAYGATGLNICEPFRIQIVLSIARNHVGNQQMGGGGYSNGGFGGGPGGNIGYGGCTLDDIKGNLQGFLNGNFQRGGWNSWFQISQVDSNNPYSTYFNLQAQMSGAINKKTNLASIELDWGKGFLSFRKCEEKTPASEQGKCPITTPGNIIQGQLEKTLGLAKDRLVLAEKFDQVIAAVVNQLITVALDKVLDTVTE